MKKNKFTYVAAAILSISMLLAACGKSPSSADTEPTPEAAEYKDELNIAITAQPPTLDAPTTSSNVAAGIAAHIFETLYTLDKDYKPAPMLAESMEISQDGLLYTFKIRQGIKFHNGKELTAEDVVASMNRWLITSSRAKVLLANAKFEQVDKYTVTLKVEQAASDIIDLLAAPAQFPAISPKEVIEAAKPEGITEYIGTGPYKLENWQQDQYIQLVRNEDYNSLESDSSGFAGKKTAATKDIYFRFVTDHSTRIAGIKTGEYDIAESIPIENYEELSTNTDVTLYSKASGTLNLFINTAKGPLANSDLRQAVLAALNNEDIMLASFSNPDLYKLNPGFMNLSQPQWAVESGKEYYNQNNPDKAKQLLTQAGYNGEPVVLVTTKDYQEMYNATLVVQDQLKKVGINAEVESYDFPVFMEHRSNPEQWDLFITSNSYQLTPPQISAVNPDWASLKKDEVTNGLNGIRFAASNEQAKAEWEKLQSFLYEYGAASVLGHYSAAQATRKTVEGFDYFHYPVYWNVKVAK
ncbi:glutathione-binding protein GsiB precursor [Oxobacter pfennigii]|uniref:Glutathione-binding protein GsiB n=1 Tax=Oxobacter pfennigii TaxID=36849 RepID=A0A0P8W4M9_9CLOT|nr:ABC transporter substrate-binding protein [Oxobacter pfennigii]KPU42450.1 glutathione-binding protein GsiB precursor [Oxobacter pfennigii]